MAKRTVVLESTEIASELFGAFDSNIRKAETTYGVVITNREGALVIDGEEEAVRRAAQAFEYLKKVVTRGGTVEEQTVDYAMSMTNDDKAEELATLDADTVCLTAKGKPIKAKTVGQKRYVDLIEKNTVIVGVGPAGTGKTFLAVAQAVAALRRKEAERIILTRPAIEAGENLGYLPGDLQSKIDPYLRPLYDALYEMLGMETVAKHMEKGIIEIAPLAYMRGRTLDNSFIILDEAQNTTPEQMKMFLTRLGFGSKAVVTGDITQTDLPRGKKSGLIDALPVLDGLDEVAIHHFTDRDVVRHRLVQRIIQAYEKRDRQLEKDSKREYKKERK
ncbi:MAG: PhoH family protein [Clostridia bacterium]|nr:PhoH family protein [Clostridia bacterium]